MFASCIYPGLENRETRGTRHPACVIACCQQSSQTQETKGRYNRGVNIRDERSVSEQVKSGLRLAGWVLLALALIFVLLGSTGFLLGKGDYNQPIYRLLGACGLLAISTVMFATVRHWAKWLIGVMGFLALKTVFALAFGSSVTRPRLWFVEFALLLGLAALLCKRYLKRGAGEDRGSRVGWPRRCTQLHSYVQFERSTPLRSGCSGVSFSLRTA